MADSDNDGLVLSAVETEMPQDAPSWYVSRPSCDTPATITILWQAHVRLSRAGRNGGQLSFDCCQGPEDDLGSKRDQCLEP